MASVRLEQRDSYQTRFDSTVTALEERGGGRWAALAESCFYPESGGQGADLGWLDVGRTRLRVTDVQKRGGGVWHRLEGEGGLAVGQRVSGEIEWPRRYRHMQRHSGQHLLSQAFVRLDPAFETRSVSLAGPVCTLDLAGGPDAEACERAETLVNEVAYQNLPIRAFEVDERELGRYPLRRPPKVSGRVRLVQVGDWELSACGGTHLRSSAEALPIKLLGQGRVKGELTRVSFCCGWEALADYREKHRVVVELARAVSAQTSELPARVAALQDELRAAQARLREAQERLAEAEAARLLQGARRLGPHRVVHALVEGEAQSLAAALCRRPDVIALLGQAQGEKASLLFMRGAAASADMNRLLREVLPLVEGRGGGKPDRAQGGGSRLAGLEQALERAAALLAPAPE